MRSLVITQNITLDGVVEMLGDWFDPQADMPDLNAALREESARSDAVLFGRATFESMRGFWPQQTDDETGVTEHLNRVTKYVVSSTLGDPEWEGSHVLSGPLREEVERLKAAGDADVVVTGSISLCHALIREALVDEYRLYVYPVVAGRGRRLFREEAQVPPLTLTGSRSFASGVTELTYRVA